MLLLRRAFQKAGLGHRLIHVRDGQMAVQYLLRHAPFSDEEQSPFPDLLLLDLKMPKMDGFDVLAAIRAQASLQDLPVVVFSSSALPVDITAATRLGASEYIVKPSGLDELMGIVARINERWLNGTPSFVRSAAQVRPALL